VQLSAVNCIHKVNNLLSRGRECRSAIEKRQYVRALVNKLKEAESARRLPRRYLQEGVKLTYISITIPKQFDLWFLGRRHVPFLSRRRVRHICNVCLQIMKGYIVAIFSSQCAALIWSIRAIDIYLLRRVVYSYR
jgi:hypothetical protein